MVDDEDGVVSHIDEFGFYKLMTFEAIHDITVPYCNRGEMQPQGIYEATDGSYLDVYWKYSLWVRNIFMPVVVWLN